MIRGRAAAVGRRRDELAILVLLGGLAFALVAGGWSWRGDRVLYDFGLSLWSRPVPPGIVIIAIDDASIEAIGRWPWPRVVHATLLEKLAPAKPKATLLDLVLSESDDNPEEDRLLALAMRKARPVLLPVVWQGGVGAPLRTLEPVEPLRTASGLGAAEAAVDADGVLRQAFMQSGPRQCGYPHIALALLSAGGESVHPGLDVTQDTQTEDANDGWRRCGSFLIRYAGPPGHVQRVSYVDVLRGRVAPEHLAGRYVLVGMTAQGLGDTLATPVNGRQHAMPGVEVLANTLYTLRSGDSIYALPPWASGLLSAALLAVLMAVFALTSSKVAIGVALASVPVLLVASLLALRSGWWWSPVAYAVAAALAYPLWSWRQLERAADALDREIERLLAAPAPPEVVEGPLRDVLAPRDRLSKRLRALRIATSTMREARRFLADALAGMPTAMLVDDGQGRVLLANPLAAALFNVDTAQQMHGLDLQQLLAQLSTETQVDWPATLASARAMNEDLVVEARLAQQGDHVVNVTGADLLGRKRVIVTIADIAPIKKAQRQREELLAFVSHDLRSPASSIVLLADMKLAGHLSTPTDELLLELRRLAQRTLQMSEDFVRAAQAESRPLALAATAVAPMLEEVIADLRPQGTAAEVSLGLAMSEGSMHWLLDAGLARRAVGNLISNAIKHSPRGGVVECEAALGEGCLVVNVKDRGRGLSDEQLRVLALGDRGLNALNSGGVGFGLLFVQRVARRHQGTLKAYPRDDGKGCVFELRFGQPGHDFGHS